MELKEFIKTAISDITSAISELQSELQNGAVVSPSMPQPISTKTIDVDGANRLISNVEFDVALTIGNTDTSSGNAKVGIQIFSAKLGGDNQSRTENVSRLTFSIPVIYPTHKVKTDKERAIEENQNRLRTLYRTIQSDRSSEDGLIP